MPTFYVGVKEVHTQMYKVEVESLEALKSDMLNIVFDEEKSEIQEDDFAYDHTIDDATTWDIYDENKEQIQ